MSDFQRGEFADFAIKGARIERITTEGVGNDVIRTAQVAVYNSSGTPYYTVLPLEWDTITVERRAPAEWPPQPGDIWAGPKNERWFAAKHCGDPDSPKDYEGCNSEGWRVILVPLEVGPYGDSNQRPDDAIRARGPLTLVHREDGNPCRCDHHGDHAGCDADCECAR